MNELVSAFRWAGAWLGLVAAAGASAGCGDVELHNDGRRSSRGATTAAQVAPERGAPVRGARGQPQSAGAIAAAPSGERDDEGEGEGDEDGANAVNPEDALGAEAGENAETGSRRAARARANGAIGADRVGVGDGTGRARPLGGIARAADRGTVATTDETALARASARAARIADRARAAEERATTGEAEGASVTTSATTAAGAQGAEARATTEGLRVRSVVVSRGVANRVPVGPGATFGANDGTPVYTYVEAENPGTEPAELVFSWRREGGRAVGGQRIEVPAGSRRWRTWALTRNARQAGSWTAEVRSADGRVLGSRSFVVAP